MDAPPRHLGYKHDSRHTTPRRYFRSHSHKASCSYCRPCEEHERADDGSRQENASVGATDEPQMLFLIDRAITGAFPELLRASNEHSTRVEVRTFDFVGAASSISSAFSDECPKVVLVDRVWLHLAWYLMQILNSEGGGRETCQPSKLVVGAKHVDEVLRVQVRHRGFNDCVELARPAREVIARLIQMQGEPPMTSPDYRWNSLPLPAAVSHPNEISRDDIDVAILELLSVGVQDADIGEIVHISTQTVKNRVSAMLSRSGLRNRTQLAWWHANHAFVMALHDAQSGRAQAQHATAGF